MILKNAALCTNNAAVTTTVTYTSKRMASKTTATMTSTSTTTNRLFSFFLLLFVIGSTAPPTTGIGSILVSAFTTTSTIPPQRRQRQHQHRQRQQQQQRQPHTLLFVRQLNTNDNTQHDTINSLDAHRELLSVAPMMGHTNRHYRYYYRLLSKRTYLYTEMIPSSQIWAAYQRAKEIYRTPTKSTTTAVAPSLNSNKMDTRQSPHPEEIIDVVTQVMANPSLEYISAGKASASLLYDILTLHQLLATSPSSKNSDESPVVLQLGGNDPTTLGVASAIATVWGRYQNQQNNTDSQQSSYTSINLNCGCPSNAVGGRAGGCALMATPTLVAHCVDAMKDSIDTLWHTMTVNNNTIDSSLSQRQHPPTVTVKHRLGIRDASTYDATEDKRKDDTEAFQEVSSFIQTVSISGSVPTFQIHARLGLLGDFSNDDTDNDHDVTTDSNHNKKQTLWVPGTTSTTTMTGDNAQNQPTRRIKIDHKREQEKARRRARKGTIQNRSIPPLRSKVIHLVAEKFPQLQFVTNGGIDNIEQVKHIVDHSNQNVVGAMVGRTIINHPCSFADADQLLWNDKEERGTTRGDVLLQYIQYCDVEEERMITSYCISSRQIESLRRRLIAVPYHLFVGEQGNDEYQRCISRLRNKLKATTNSNTSSSSSSSMKSSSILLGAMSFVPQETLHKRITEYVKWEEIPKYDHLGGLKRGSALQRVIY